MPVGLTKAGLASGYVPSGPNRIETGGITVEKKRDTRKNFPAITSLRGHTLKQVVGS